MFCVIPAVVTHGREGIIVVNAVYGVVPGCEEDAVFVLDDNVDDELASEVKLPVETVHTIEEIG